MKNQVFIPITDDLIYEHPDQIDGPLVPYSAGMDCHGEISRIMENLERPDTRIWVLDSEGTPRSVRGDILDLNIGNQIEKPNSSSDNFTYLWGYIRYYYILTLRTVFSYIVEKTADAARATNGDIDRENRTVIDTALSGEPVSLQSPAMEDGGTILISAHPVLNGDSVIGAVIAEQSANVLLQRQQKILENVISVTLLVLITVLLSLLFFASRLTLRITRLRNSAENSHRQRWKNYQPTLER